MRGIATACGVALLAAACGKKGPDPEIARLNGVIDALRKEMADDKAAKEREIAELKAQLAEATKQAGIAAEAEALKRRFEELKASSEARLRDLEATLEAKGREAAAALARIADLEKLKAGLDASLLETKSLLDKRSKDLDALKAELANLKKLLGR